MMRYTSGCICVPMTGRRSTGSTCRRWSATTRTAADRVHGLGRRPRRRHAPASPRADRARTIAAAGRSGDRPRRADPARPRLPAAREDGRRAAPSRPHRGGGRPGPAGRPDPGRRASCEIVSERTAEMARLPRNCAMFAEEHGLAMISIADLIAYRRRTEKQVERVAEARLPDRARRVHRVRLPRPRYDEREHVALRRTATSATARTCWSACTPSA